MERIIPASELIINSDGSVFHLHVKPEMLTDRIILVGEPSRVDMVASFFDKKIFEVQSREFHTITGEYKGKPIMCVSHGIGADNIDIVINELDALANVDFATRKVKKDFRQLSMVRIGTSGTIPTLLMLMKSSQTVFSAMGWLWEPLLQPMVFMDLKDESYDWKSPTKIMRKN